MYNKFKVQDNAYGNLLSGISASATTINLETGDGDRFPADNFVATFVEYTTTGDDTTPILGQEKILVSARSGDTLTVTRGYDGSTPRSFNAGDNIYLNVTSVIIEDIQDEVTRLENDKLDISDFNSTLRNNLGNWKVIYTNGSGDETELTLGSAGQFLKSNGATSAPIWESPTVDINGLTEDNDTLDTDDMLVYYDGTSNKKRKAKASTTQEGLNKIASDATAIAGTDETDTINSKQLKNWAGFTWGYGGGCIARSDSTVNGSATGINYKRIQIKGSGTINVSVVGSSNDSASPYPRIGIYINSTLIAGSGDINTGTSPVTLTATDVTVVDGDYINVKLTQTGSDSVDISNLRIFATPIPNYGTATIIA